MARQVYVFRDGKMVPIEQAGEVKSRPEIITDEMPPTQHMCDGQMYTSKKKFRNVTKMFGCVEVGDSEQKPKEYTPSKDIKRMLLESWNQLESGKR